MIKSVLAFIFLFCQIGDAHSAPLVIGAIFALAAPTGYAAVGYAIGSFIGSMLFPPKGEDRTINGPTLTDLKVTGTEYGQVIPYVRGHPRIAGQIWWASDRRPITTTIVTESGGKGGGGSTTTQTSTVYEVDLLIGLSDNELDGFTRGWINGQLVYNILSSASSETFDASNNSNLWERITFYGGAEDQLPDPDYMAAVGAANAPAYRGRSYIFIKSFQLGPAPANIPNFTFEVAASTISGGSPSATVTTLNTVPFAFANAHNMSKPEGSGSDWLSYNWSGSQVKEFLGNGLGGAMSLTGNVIALNKNVPPWNSVTHDCFSYYSGGPSYVPNSYELYRNIGGSIVPACTITLLSGENYYQEVGRARWCYNADEDIPIATGGKGNASGNLYDHSVSLINSAGSIVATIDIRVADTDASWIVADICMPGDGNIWILGVASNLTSFMHSYRIWVYDLSATPSLINTLENCPEVSSIGRVVSSEGMYVNVDQGAFIVIEDPDRIYKIYLDGTTDPLVLASTTASTSAVKQQLYVGRYEGYLFGVRSGANVLLEKIEWGFDLFGSTELNDESVSLVVSDLCVRAGLQSSQIDVTALNDITREVRGMAVSQLSTTRSVLELLATDYFFECTVSDKLYFIPRGGSSVLTLDYEELGASTGDPVEPLPLKQANDIELPAQVSVTYPNVDNDYNTDTQMSDRVISAIANSVSNAPIPLVMTASEAKQVADVMVLDRVVSGLSTKICVLGEYSKYEPTDVITLTDPDGGLIRMRIVRKNDAYPSLEFECVADDASVLESQGITNDDYVGTGEVSAPVDTLMELMDIPILRDADDDSGIYVSAKGDGSPYPGSVIYKSSDDISMEFQTSITESAVMGDCTTVLGSWYGPRIFDEISSVTVDVGGGELSTTTRSAILNNTGVNLMLIGSEIIQFRTATLVGVGIYKLTGLLRGCRGTEWAMTGHASNERCALLQSTGLRRVQMQNNELGISKYWRGITIGRTLSSEASEEFTNNAISLKPFSPVYLRASRDASGNITFTWEPRSRLSVRIVGALGISVPLGEAVESYEMDIYTNSGYGTVVRTLTSSTPTVQYTAAQQVTDFGTVQYPVYNDLFMLSQTVGRGYNLRTAR